MSRNFYIVLSDYILFAIIVLGATLVPLWSRFFGKKNASTKADYVFAAGAVSVFSMMLSIARGTLGVRSFLGFPSEQFYRGIGMWETIYGMVNAYPIVAFVFIPVYFNLKFTSVYQYIELRFHSKLVRCLASGTYIFRSILNQGVTVFTPTIAIYTIFKVPIWVSLVAITVLSIFFNLLGGLKQAVMADVIQLAVAAIVSMAIIIQTTIIAGGITNVFVENRDSDRLNLLNFTGDLTVRVDTISAWLGQLFMSLSLYGCQQNFVQRYLSMKSVGQVTRMLMMNIPVVVTLFSLSWIVGMCIYSVYSDCDPLKAGFAKSTDEILPFYMEDKFSYIPGLMGIFLSTLFNSALMLNISNLNSLATVTWEDFLCNFSYFKDLKDRHQLKIIKIIGTIYGLMIMGVGFLVQFSTGVIESAQLMTSATSGPLLGVFLLAILVPVANWKGATAGMILSHIVILTMTFGHLVVDQTSGGLMETSIDGCTNDSFSRHFWEWNGNVTLLNDKPEAESANPPYIFNISYMYYSLFGTSITVIVGILVSIFTASKNDAFESKYVHPLVYKIAKKFKGHKRIFLEERESMESIKSVNDVGRNNRIENHGFSDKKS